MSYVLKADARDERHKQVYCNLEQHVAIVFPANEHSGEACEVETSHCDCDKHLSPESADAFEKLGA